MANNWNSDMFGAVDKNGLDFPSFNYSEFLRKKDISAGIYVLSEGEQDLQAPHTSDELYSIVEGVSKLKIKDNIYNVSKKDIFYVPKETEHKFFDIQNKLKVLVVFGVADKTPHVLKLYSFGLDERTISEVLSINLDIVKKIVESKV